MRIRCETVEIGFLLITHRAIINYPVSRTPALTVSEFRGQRADVSFGRNVDEALRVLDSSNICIGGLYAKRVFSFRKVIPDRPLRGLDIAIRNQIHI